MSIVKLGDICEFINGGAWSDKEYVNSGLPVLKVSNCKNSGFQIEEINYLPVSSKEKYKKNRLFIGDIIIATVGSHPNLIESAAGRSCVVNSLVEGFYLNQNAVCLRTMNPEILDQGYLSYICKERTFVHYIQNKGRGAANQMRIAIGAIKEYEFDLPKISLQRKIANILSTYDFLIENNQKQIKLLEEAAQRLYKEWFVDLHFPGYEDVKIVGGVPEGWSKGTLGDVAENSGYNEKKEHRDKYSYYLPIDCLPKKSVAYTYINDISLAESSLVAFKPNDILFGAMRPYFHKVVIARDYGLTRSTCFVIKSKESTTWSFLAMLLFSEDTINYATRISVGTTMPYVRWKDFIQMPVLIPTEQMCIEFGKQFIPISKKIMKLAEQNIRLTQARDRLLPKLMSGELEV